MINAGLVLEGGGLRGIYTAGVLEYFQEHDISFPYVIGVSAGACMASSFLSEQSGRNKRVNIDFIKDKRYISYKNLLLKGELFGMDFIFDEIPNHIIPLDIDRILKNPAEFVIVTTDCISGQPTYFYKEDYNKDTLAAILRASSSIPFFADPVNVNGRNMLDGGITDSIPLVKAQEDGNSKNIVVLTRPRGYYKKPSRTSKVVKYRDYPLVDEQIQVRYKHYNERLDYVFEEEKKGNVLVIAPSEDTGVGRTTRNRKKLEKLYNLGYEDAKDKFDSIVNFT